ncbi:hypothetical protein BKA62DRAFT_90004 [Auriculariales sp. MPI-PUGE-AT-0066]|nr:hypothetical protein BKA62DRAFT_90004 [Auriculariales sp. MPI-PUGE-AT-0066]
MKTGKVPPPAFRVGQARCRRAAAPALRGPLPCRARRQVILGQPPKTNLRLVSSDASLSHTQTTTSPSAPSDPSGSVLRTTNSASSIGLESGAGLAVNPTSTPGAVSLSDPNTLTVIVVPTVVGVLVLAVLLALLFRRCRNRRRAAIDASARMEAGFETVTVPQLPTSATTTQAEQSFATKATYSIDSQSAIVAPVSAHHFSYDHSQDASPTSALYVDLPSPNHRVAWRPEKLPEIDSPGSPHSNHSRTPSMAERRTQRLMRALQDVEPPLPTAHAI